MLRTGSDFGSATRHRWRAVVQADRRSGLRAPAARRALREAPARVAFAPPEEAVRPLRDTDLFADVVFRDADVPFEDLLDWLFRWAEELRAAEDFALERSLEDVFDLLAVGAVPESGRPFDAR